MKRIISSFMLVFMCISFMGCDKKEEKVDLGVVKVAAYGKYIDMINIAAAKFKESEVNSEVDIEIENIDPDMPYEEFKNIVENDMDIVILPGHVSNDMILYHDDDFESLNNYLSEEISNFNKNKLIHGVVEKNLKALPIDMKPVALYYRGDILKEANIDDKDIITWNDIVNMKDIFNKNHMKAMGVVIEGEGAIYHLLLNQLNIDYVDDSLKSTLMSEKSVKAINLIKSLYNDNMIKIYKDKEDMIEGALKGEVFSFLDNNSALYSLMDVWDKDSWAVMKAPSFEAGGNRCIMERGDDLFLLKGSKNKDVAVKFMSYISTNKDVLLECMKSLYIMPAYDPIYKNEIFDSQLDKFGGQRLYRFFESIINCSNGTAYNIKSCKIDQYLEEKINTIIQSDTFESKIEEETKNINNMLRID